MKFAPTEQQFQRYDRHLRIASAVVGESRETVIRKFVMQRVLLVVNPSLTPSADTRIMLTVAANLIARFCPKIDLAFSDTCPELIANTLSHLKRIDTSPYAEFRVVLRPDYSLYAAVLAIGRPGTREATTTVIDSVGWLALLNPPEAGYPLSKENHNSPFGALLAAALGAAEVFKYLLHPPVGTIAHFGSVTLSAFDYSLNGMDPGPWLPSQLRLPWGLLGGIGAVGNAFLLALSLVDGLSGDLLVIDQDIVESTNLNRYVLAYEADADREHPVGKTQLAMRLFHGRALRVSPHQEPLNSVLGKIHREEITRPEILLSAVDNNDARWAMQNLWPQLILEGATDHTLSQVSRHEYGKPLACLGCIHPRNTTPKGDASYIRDMISRSGILGEAITLSHQNADTILLADHIAPEAPEYQRRVLQRNIGKPICSILSELELISTKPTDELPVQPSVSFVSMMSGLFMAGELVKFLGNLQSPLVTLYQLDTFFPVTNAFLLQVDKTNSCECVVRRREIAAYRLARRQAANRVGI